VAFPSPTAVTVLPNRKGVVFVIVKRTTRAFFRVLAESQAVH